MRAFHKPLRRPGDVIESWDGGGDPAEAASLAHDSAAALLHRVRQSADPVLVERVIAYADEHGIDDVAELWASAAPDTLPGALWRIYLLRHAVRANPERLGYEFRRGAALDGVNQAVAGSPDTPTPDEVVVTATQILRGAFSGDFAVALERASAFCRVLEAGHQDLQERHPDDLPPTPYAGVADELRHAAHLWRQGQLT